MIIYPISAFTDNYIWALIDKKEGLFDCVDPGDASAVLHFAQKHHLDLRSILITHHHSDHIGGVQELKHHYPDCLIYGPVDSRIPIINVPLTEGQSITIQEASYQIFFTPGHTATHIAYFETKKRWLFCGDTLFSGGCGRVFDGTLEALHDSLQRLKKLPAATQIFCAHEYTKQNLQFALLVEPENQDLLHYKQQINHPLTRCTLPSVLEQELLINPFLRTDQSAVQHYALKHGAISTNSLDVFRVLRAQKNLSN
ncbi:MAG: hydroxyacylglutathione hydrolase [Legionella sp.]|nr:MAG: hydroxyacylglutathione hydrolase [Legionella sp.]PJD99261.1 MAG: hydroxyacylglutathione hydrolase [Legionella sp.]